MNWWVALGMVVVGGIGLLIGLTGLAVAIGRSIRAADREVEQGRDD